MKGRSKGRAWACYAKLVKPRRIANLATTGLAITALSISLAATGSSDHQGLAVSDSFAISRVTETASGDSFNSSSGSSSISDDGQLVAFQTYATNLIPEDNNVNCFEPENNDYYNCPDIFVKNIKTKSITLVSQNSLGEQANGENSWPEISANGRFVAFTSRANNLVADDTNQCYGENCADVFVKDLLTGNVARASTDAQGAQANGQSSAPSISAEGRYVAFASNATNLVPNDSNTLCYENTNCTDIFVKDMQTGAIVLASTSSTSLQANNHSSFPVISGNGRFVAFTTQASNLVDNDDNVCLYGYNCTDIFVKDLETGNLTRISTDSNGNQANGQSEWPSLSNDGRLIAFNSQASNLVPNDTNNSVDVFVKDTQTGSTVRVSTDSQGNQAVGQEITSREQFIAAGGSVVAFASTAKLTPDASSEPFFKLYLKDLSSGATTRTPYDWRGNANGINSGGPSLTADGKHLAFSSTTDNLVPTDQNRSNDLFAVSLASQHPDLINIKPVSGWSKQKNIVVEADLTSPATGAVIVKLDGNNLASCSISDGHLSCSVSDISDGAHAVLFEIVDAEGYSVFRSQDFSIDTVAPTISAVTPSGWVKDANVYIEADLADERSGIDVNSAQIKVDGNQPLQNCTTSSSHVRCAAPSLSDGDHSFEITIADNAQNNGAVLGNFKVDATKPAIFNTKPTGNNGREFEISADFSDEGSGVNGTATMLKVNNVDVSNKASMTDGHLSYQGSGDGTQQVHLEVKDKAGNVQVAEWSFITPSPGYFTWYDNIYGRTWVMMSSPVESAGNLFDLYIGTQMMNPDQRYGVAPGQTAPQIYGGKMGGPVKVVPYSAEPALISERSLFGNSFEEIWATPYESLDSHYYWPFYDQATPGMQDWVLVANPRESSDAVEAEVRLHIPAEYGGDKVVSRVIAPGESWAPSFPGYAAGPVEVKAWKANSNRWDPANARKVIASQRVLWYGAFNEMPGIPASKLSNAYVWTWYDNNSPQATDDILIGNPNGQRTFIVVVLGKQVVYAGYVDPNDFLPLRAKKGSPTGMGGPLIVFSCSDEQCNGPGGNIYATQRIHWGPSFGEIAGTPFEDITDSAHWTWYDQLTPGVVNWVLVSNITNDDIYMEMKIGGKLVKQQVIASASSFTPTFPNYMDGPVEVKAWKSELEPAPGGGQRQKKVTPYPVFASQRVLWNGYFNEIVGKGL